MPAQTFPRSRLHSAAALTVLLLLAFTVAALGGAATASSVTSWYPTLAKPTWTPPSAVFGPAWTTLYILMSLATWRIWRRADLPGRKVTLALHGVQLALNALWSVLFFGLRNPTLAFVNILALLAVLLVLQVRLARADRPAAFLWIPYLLWVAFATALNFSIVRLN